MPVGGLNTIMPIGGTYPNWGQYGTPQTLLYTILFSNILEVLGAKYCCVQA